MHTRRHSYGGAFLGTDENRKTIAAVFKPETVKRHPEVSEEPTRRSRGRFGLEEADPQWRSGRSAW
ncbi:hypothetical protein EYF80_046504 [Liparis tanakae]|uniref:Uncharacterized protein n=1 Tax=Liparis tanakae TaxID=230148 RepID=A0A4Z2FQ99_9TELE|nr:hypothetical protein EYF80_046504 [Liparis tanakae]